MVVVLCQQAREEDVIEPDKENEDHEGYHKTGYASSHHIPLVLSHDLSRR